LIVKDVLLILGLILLTVLTLVSNFLLRIGTDEEGRQGRRSEMASNAAVPFWRAAGMTYISYSNICANIVRNCLKEPHKAEALTREKVHFSLSKWADGKPQKPVLRSDTPEV
jgi:F-type H+-transporting ATPase subunit epsilon